MDADNKHLVPTDLGFASVGNGYDIYMMRSGIKIGELRRPAIKPMSGFFIEIFGMTWKNAKPGARVIQEIDAVSPKAFATKLSEAKNIVLNKLNGTSKR